MYISRLRDMYMRNKPEKEESLTDRAARHHRDNIINQIKLVASVGMWLPMTYYICEGMRSEQWYEAVNAKVKQLLLELGFAVKITYEKRELPFSKCVIRDPKETST